MIHPKDDELSKEQHRHVPREHSDPAGEKKGLDQQQSKPEKQGPENNKSSEKLPTKTPLDK